MLSSIFEDEDIIIKGVDRFDESIDFIKQYLTCY